ncbi:MAG: hypothetical protein ACLRSD_01410 [Oscillibacter sp.]
MSFAYDVKAELCKVPINRSCCAVAEGCGVLLYASAFTANEVRIVTENDEFAARLPKLFQRHFPCALTNSLTSRRTAASSSSASRRRTSSTRSGARSATIAGRILRCT